MRVRLIKKNVVVVYEKMGMGNTKIIRERKGYN